MDNLLYNLKSQKQPLLVVGGLVGGLCWLAERWGVGGLVVAIVKVARNIFDRPR